MRKHIFVVDLKFRLPHGQQHQRHHNAQQNGHRQVKEDGGGHGHQEFQNSAFEFFGENIADGLPLVYPPGGDHQHPGQSAQRDLSHHRPQGQHGDQQEKGVEHTGEPGAGAGFYRHTGTGNGRSGRDAAKQRGEDVADTLGQKLPVIVQLDAGHPAGAGSAEQAFHHAQSGDADGRSQKPAQSVQIQRKQIEPLGQHERGRDLPYGVYRQIQHHGSGCGQDDGHQRCGHHTVPLFWKKYHKEHHKNSNGHSGPVGIKAVGEVSPHLLNGRTLYGGDAKEVIHLSQSDDHSDARSKAGDHRHGDKGREPSQLEQPGNHQKHASQESGLEHAIQAILGHNGGENGGHGSGGAGDLVKSPAQKGDDGAGHNGGEQAGGRRSAAADTEGQSQGQRHRRYRQTGHHIGQQSFGIVVCKFLL